MLTLNGLVISERIVGEANKYITLLTKEYSLIDVFVRGGAKSKKSVGATQLFCYSRFSLDCKRKADGTMQYFYNSSEPIEMFFNIRLDVVKTSLACYFTELLRFAATASDNSEEVLRLTLNCLYYIGNDSRDTRLIKSIFEFRFLCDTGYRPALLGCADCHKYKDSMMYLNLRTGLVKCTDCITAPDNPDIVGLDPTLFYIVRYIALVDLDKLFNCKVSERYQEKLTAFTERFAREIYGKEFKTLEFYKTMKS